jgi:uncharacterized membrane protein
MQSQTQLSEVAVNDSLVMVTYLIYLLHGISALGGVLSPALVVTAFVFGWPSIIAVIINYLKRDSTRGTYIESHFRWQIRTFWFALLWVIVALVLWATLLGIPLAMFVAWATGLWILYRIVRGTMHLMNNKPMPVPE